jgi:hypothetical protein
MLIPSSVSITLTPIDSDSVILQDITPAPLARAILYKAAGPISALGHQSPTLAQLMARQASLDPILTRPSSVKRKTLSLAAPLVVKKKRTSGKKVIKVRAFFL